MNINLLKRFELKFVIEQTLAAAIKNALQPYFMRDSNTPQDTNGYWVNNLYFDTADLRCYFDVKDKKAERNKFRVRYYGLQPPATIFFEIKHRRQREIWKYRCTSKCDDWPGTVRDRLEQLAQFWRNDPGVALDDLLLGLITEPVAHVRYFREAYISTVDYYGRVTFDTLLSCHPALGTYELAPHPQDLIPSTDVTALGLLDSPTILEIKVENPVPYWAMQIIQEFGLIQRGFSKYCYAIDSLAELPTPRQSKYYLDRISPRSQR